MNNLYCFSDEIIAAYLDGNVERPVADSINELANTDSSLSELLDLYNECSDMLKTDSSFYSPEHIFDWAYIDYDHSSAFGADDFNAHFLLDDSSHYDSPNNIGIIQEDETSTDFLFDTTINDI